MGWTPLAFGPTRIVHVKDHDDWLEISISEYDAATRTVGKMLDFKHADNLEQAHAIAKAEGCPEPMGE